jgi:hypothetical protein
MYELCESNGAIIKCHNSKIPDGIYTYLGVAGECSRFGRVCLPAPPPPRSAAQTRTANLPPAPPPRLPLPHRQSRPLPGLFRRPPASASGGGSSASFLPSPPSPRHHPLPAAAAPKVGFALFLHLRPDHPRLQPITVSVSVYVRGGRCFCSTASCRRRRGASLAGEPVQARRRVCCVGSDQHHVQETGRQAGSPPPPAPQAGRGH